MGSCVGLCGFLGRNFNVWLPRWGSCSRKRLRWDCVSLVFDSPQIVCVPTLIELATLHFPWSPVLSWPPPMMDGASPGRAGVSVRRSVPTASVRRRGESQPPGFHLLGSLWPVLWRGQVETATVAGVRRAALSKLPAGFVFRQEALKSSCQM